MVNPHYCHWLVKQEPGSYTWEQFLRDGTTRWDGVRSFQARNNLRAMQKGDAVLFYRSQTDPAVLGLCRVARPAYPDPTAGEGDWSAADLRAVRTLHRPVTLAEIKTTPALKNMALLKQSRLSVLPLTSAEFDILLALSKQLT